MIIFVRINQYIVGKSQYFENHIHILATILQLKEIGLRTEVIQNKLIPLLVNSEHEDFREKLFWRSSDSERNIVVGQHALVCTHQNSPANIWPLTPEQSKHNPNPSGLSGKQSEIILLRTCPADAAFRSQQPVLQSNWAGNTKPKMKSVDVSRQWKHLGCFFVFLTTLQLKTSIIPPLSPTVTEEKILQRLCFADSCHDFVSTRSMCGLPGAKYGRSQPDNILGVHHHSIIPSFHHSRSQSPGNQQSSRSMQILNNKQTLCKNTRQAN